MKKKTQIKNNSEIFFEYITRYGFDPTKYTNILELYQNAENSISRYIRNYNHFLLSENVNEKELHKYGIYGSYGYIKDGNIIIPGKPSIMKTELDEFDVIISNGILPTMKDLEITTQDIFVGFCTNDNNYEEMEKNYIDFYLLTQKLQHSTDFQIYFEHDTISDGKEICLIKRKK